MSVSVNLSKFPQTQHYGYLYDYTKRLVNESDYLGPLPEWQKPILAKLESIGFDNKIDQAIINEYVPGQGIGPHIDR